MRELPGLIEFVCFSSLSITATSVFEVFGVALQLGFF